MNFILYNRCDWCEAAFDLGTPYMLVDDHLRCCMDCWNNFGIREHCEIRGDTNRMVYD